jgi:hypothetical protein
MASGIGVIGLDITDVESAVVGGVPQFALGARGAIDSQSGGVREYLYVQFAASTAFTVGQVCAVTAAGVATPLTVTNSAPGQAVGRRVGVAVVAVGSLATAQYGWVQIYGVGAVLANTGAALNTALNTTGTSGQVDDDAGSGAEVIDGLSLNATVGGAPAVTAAFLNYPYVGRTL